MWVPLYLDGYGYLRSIDRNYRAMLIHRACWEAYYGRISGEFHVHHVNGDKLNNDISNLACMAPKIHRRIHGLGGALRPRGSDDEAV